MERLLLVMLGGALGSGARWLVGLAAAARLSLPIPMATLCVNVLGSFAMAFLAQLVAQGASFSPEKRLFLATGCLGGFTTYSSFNQETLDYAARGEWSAAFLYAFGTMALCLAAGLGGMAAGRAFLAGS